ncbi:MAG: diguanylate cyclase [Symploca sp. SIO1A3]|nr:diguanylate cyclase [Symploca sp. SIO1A3]
MNVDEVLEIVEQVLLSRRLSPVEQLILRQSWLKQSYSDIAEHSTYDYTHLKEVASQLWYELSKALGKKVTKKNLPLVLKKYQQDKVAHSTMKVPQEFLTPAKAQPYFPSSVPQTLLAFPGAPVPPDSPLYIHRPPIEELACSQISQPGCVLRIKAPKKMGKSSLLNRVMAHAKALDYNRVFLDFQEAEEAVFASLDKFLRWLCANLSRCLHLNPRLEDYWDEELGSKVSCRIYIEGYLLERIDSPLVLAFNEVNRVFEHPQIAQEFLPMLRFWHEQARVVENWQKLRVVVVHTTEVYIPLKLNQSPFNVGLSIKLLPFTREQVEELAALYGLDWSNNNYSQQLMTMVGGHPYLVNMALYYLCRGGMSLEELLQAAPTQGGIYTDHLRSHLAILRDEPQLALALQQLASAKDSIPIEALTQSQLPSAIAAYKLESMGLVKLEGNQVSISCQLYRIYFRQQLKEEQGIEVQMVQLEQQKQEIQRLYNMDELTQLPNQHYINQYLETKWQQIRGVQPLSLILCNIDYFRFYNDAHGNPAGDATLQQIASAISNWVRDPKAVVARYGGDEFAVILPRTDTKAAAAIAENLREGIKTLEIAYAHPRLSGFPSQVLTFSLGVATTVPNPDTSPAMLIAAAQEALSESKLLERDRVTVK